LSSSSSSSSSSPSPMVSSDERTLLPSAVLLNKNHHTRLRMRKNALCAPPMMQGQHTTHTHTTHTYHTHTCFGQVGAVALSCSPLGFTVDPAPTAVRGGRQSHVVTHGRAGERHHAPWGWGVDACTRTSKRVRYSRAQRWVSLRTTSPFKCLSAQRCTQRRCGEPFCRRQGSVCDSLVFIGLLFCPWTAHRGPHHSEIVCLRTAHRLPRIHPCECAHRGETIWFPHNSVVCTCTERGCVCLFFFGTRDVFPQP
jgi:hypothetical protein